MNRYGRKARLITYDFLYLVVSHINFTHKSAKKAHRLYYHSTKNGNGYKINMIEFIGDVNL